MRSHIAVGLTVRCCRSYEEVHEGDVGTVVKLDRDGLHDLNVQVGTRVASRGGGAGSEWLFCPDVCLSKPFETLPDSLHISVMACFVCTSIYDIVGFIL